MQIEIDGEDLFVNGKFFSACRCDLGSGDYKVVLLSRSGQSHVYVVGAAIIFTDQENENGVLVGQYIIDGVAINARATLAKLYRKVLDAIEEGQIVTLEVT